MYSMITVPYGQQGDSIDRILLRATEIIASTSILCVLCIHSTSLAYVVSSRSSMNALLLCALCSDTILCIPSYAMDYW